MRILQQIALNALVLDSGQEHASNESERGWFSTSTGKKVIEKCPQGENKIWKSLGQAQKQC
jgi:hypothetical protein